MIFRLGLPLELERPTGEMTTAVRVEVQIVYDGGKWRMQCQDPPVATLMCDSLEEALITGTREIMQEWAAEEKA